MDIKQYLNESITNSKYEKYLFGILDRGLKGWLKEINNVIEKAPKDSIPNLIIPFSMFKTILNRTLNKYEKNNYGVSISQSTLNKIPLKIINDEILKKIRSFSLYKNDDDGWEQFLKLKKSHTLHNFLFDISDFMVVGFNSKYKTPSMLTTHKDMVNNKYNISNGNDYHLNKKGELTIWHEFGHVFDKRRFISGSTKWKDLTFQWSFDKEFIMPDMLKNSNSEAFAEAFANVLGDNSSKVPKYISDFIKSIT